MYEARGVQWYGQGLSGWVTHPEDHILEESEGKWEKVIEERGKLGKCSSLARPRLRVPCWCVVGVGVYVYKGGCAGVHMRDMRRHHGTY